MTLEQFRNASLAVSVAAIIIISVVLTWASREVSSALIVTRAADDVRNVIQELNYLAVDTILHHEERSQTHWDKKNAELISLLSRTDWTGEYSGILEILRRNMLGAQALYPQLVENHQAALESVTGQEQFRELEARIVSRLLGQFQDMRADTITLGNLGMVKLLEAQRLLILLTILFIGFMSIIILANWALVSIRVIKPISQLKKGAELVAAGDFNYRNEYSRPDEIGDMAKAFDTMTENIQITLRQLESEISARTHIERELRESREQIRAVTETAMDAIISFDVRGKIFQFNRGAESMFGYNSSETKNMPMDRLLPRCETEQAEITIFDVLSDLNEVTSQQIVEMHGARKDGCKFPVEMSVASWKVDKGNFFTAIIRDISARKNAENNLKHSLLELEAFSYSVSHDLRAPLRHINGFVALLNAECGTELNRTCRDYLKMISDSATLMGKLIDDLLEFSRMGRANINVTTFNMGNLVHEVMTQVMQDAKGRDVQYDIGNLPDVSGDRAMLKQVWINLISNALKYSRPRDKAILKLGFSRDGGEIEFYIRDNGVGFDMKYVEQLFGVFHRLHRQEDFEGTGVGLANVQRIVQRHGGRVWAVGEVNRGATFYFTLPVQVNL